MADSDGEHNPMVNRSLKPDSIARIVELARKHCTAEQWGEWLGIPLEFAAFEGDREVAEELTLAGATGNAFEAAIRGGQYDFLHRHLETPRDHHLHQAVELGHGAIVSLMLDRGADIEAGTSNSECLTPLLLAARAGHDGIVGLLLGAGASVARRIRKYANGADTYVETASALDLAAIGGHVDVIEAITQRKPSYVNSVSPSTKFTALHYAAKHGQLGAMDALVEAGADLEAQDGDEKGTALHVAVRSSDCKATLLSLLRHGAHIDSTRGGNVTPLCAAVKAKNKVATDILLSAGADANIPLLAASAEPFSSETVLTLLGRGADANTRRESDGSTPLHLAAEARLKSNVDILLKAGGDETAVNDKGKIPLDVVGHEPLRMTFLNSGFYSSKEDIRTLLENAPGDRADRTWSRRGFFVMCRAFPERVRLQLAPSQDDRVNDASSAASPATNDPVISRENKRRTATAEARGGEREQLAGALTEEDAAAFRAAMGRLIGLGTDIVFRTIVEFV